MRILSAELLAAQKSGKIIPQVSTTISDVESGGTTNYYFDNKGLGTWDKRIIDIVHTEEPFGGNCIIRLANADKYLTTRNLKGFKVNLGWGCMFNSTQEVSIAAPLFVLNQKDISQEGELVTELFCLDYWWKLANSYVVRAGIRLNGSISGLFEYGEKVTSSPGGYTARVLQISGSSIIISSYTGTQANWNSETSAVGYSSTAVVTITSADTIQQAGGADYGESDSMSTIKEILDSITSGVLHSVVIDSDSPVGENQVNVYKPTLTTEEATGVRGLIRQLLQMTPCVGRIDKDAKLRILYPDPAAVADYVYQTDHAFWYQLRERAVIIPNKVAFINHRPAALPDGVAQYYGTAEDATSVGLLGEFPSIQVNNSISSTTEAEKLADAWIKQRLTEAYQGGVRAPMNCGQELYDQVSIVDARSGISVAGRVGKIIRRYHSQQAVYDIELTLGGIVSEAGAVGGPGTTSIDLHDLTTEITVDRPPVKAPAAPLGKGNQAYIANITFTPTAYNAISWTAGNVTFADGATQAVNSGSLSLANANPYYLYVEWGNAVLQNTQTYTTAVGSNKVLVAVAKRASTTAQMAFVFNPHQSNILINTDNVMDGLVTSLKIASEAVVEAKIAANAVTQGKIAASSIVGTHIQAGQIDAGHIQTDAITAIKIKAGAVTALKIDVATLSAISASLGTVNVGAGGITVTADDAIQFYQASVKVGKVYLTTAYFGLWGSSNTIVSLRSYGTSGGVDIISESYATVTLWSGVTSSVLLSLRNNTYSRLGAWNNQHLYLQTSGTGDTFVESANAIYNRISANTVIGMSATTVVLRSSSGGSYRDILSIDYNGATVSNGTFKLSANTSTVNGAIWMVSNKLYYRSGTTTYEVATV